MNLVSVATRGHVAVRAALMGVAVLSCSDAPSAAHAGGSNQARIALNPKFSRAAAVAYAQRSSFASIDFDHVRIAIIRPPVDTVKDDHRVLARRPEPHSRLDDRSANSRRKVRRYDAVHQQWRARLQGHVEKLISYAADQAPPPEPDLVITYVGPGASATRVMVAPQSTAGLSSDFCLHCNRLRREEQRNRGSARVVVVRSDHRDDSEQDRAAAADGKTRSGHRHCNDADRRRRLRVRFDHSPSVDHKSHIWRRTDRDGGKWAATAGGRTGDGI